MKTINIIDSIQLKYVFEVSSFIQSIKFSFLYQFPITTYIILQIKCKFHYNTPTPPLYTILINNLSLLYKQFIPKYTIYLKFNSFIQINHSNFINLSNFKYAPPPIPPLIIHSNNINQIHCTIFSFLSNKQRTHKINTCINSNKIKIIYLSLHLKF